ncbi:hypothetical protein [Methanoregula sp. UBA64]|jgi:hypothetical protein|uniref:hypothetical protein n=1 Tax=Methanoregula sp. UBA64 TaxID=1915554 RepID=UPI0025CE7435|nr:hypothetical protein [Methanoregula sp. UBA64]
MFERATVGEWVILVLSAIFALIVAFSKQSDGGGIHFSTIFSVSFIIFLIILYILYWIVTKLYPKSANWGVIGWTLAIIGLSFLLCIMLAVIAAFVFGMAGDTTASAQTGQNTNPTVSASTIAAQATIINSNTPANWGQYANNEDQFIIFKPSDWSAEQLDKSEIFDKSDSDYSLMMEKAVYVFTPNMKGFVIIYGVDATGTLYSIFDDKEKTKISDELYDQIVDGVKKSGSDKVKFTSIVKDSNYYLINGNPARRMTLYMTANGESLSGDWYVIAHGNKYYILGYSAMNGATQSDSSTATTIMQTFATM